MMIGSRILTLLLCFMMCVNIAFAEPTSGSSSTGTGSSSSSTTDSDKDKDKDGEESEEKDSIAVVKVKDKDGKEVEIEIKNGQTPDGKIWIGAGAVSKQTAVKKKAIKETKVDGQSVPGLTLVQNMRNLVGKMPFQLSAIGMGGTGCVYAVTTAAEGTPYGGPMTTTTQLIDKAKELNQCIDVSPQNFDQAIATIMPGDIVIVGASNGKQPGYYAGIGSKGYGDEHAVMATNNPDGSIGTIQNGNSGSTDEWGKKFGGVHETTLPPWNENATGWPVVGYIIKTSGCSANMIGFGEAIMKLGEAMNQIIEKFCQVAQEGYNRLIPYTFDILACLCMIDLALTIMLAGFEVNPNQLFVKIIKYGFIYWVVVMWPTLVDAAFKSMVVSANEIAFPMYFESGSENICQPQLILQKVMYLLKPGFDYFQKMGFTEVVVSIVTGSIALMALAGIMCIITMLIYIMFACYVAYVYIYFFVLAALSVCTLPFLGSKFMKFFTEGAVGSVWSAAVKMMALTFMLGLMGVIFSGSDFQAANEVVKTAGGGAANFGGASLFDIAKNNYDMFIFFIKQCFMMILFAFFTFRIVNSLSSHLGGRFEFNT